MRGGSHWIILLLSALTTVNSFAGDEIAGLSDSLGMSYVTIPSGTFIMGDDGYGAERHSVTISSFEMMSTPVTQGMWEEVMGYNPVERAGIGPEYPVHNVSWRDCQSFIERLDELDPEYEYRLPSEAEWEYACRAGTTTTYYWGNSLDQAGFYGWFNTNSSTSFRPVAQKLPNAWGLYDMCGNVYEWCADYWHYGYAGAPVDGSAWDEPTSDEYMAHSRILRGASIEVLPNGCTFNRSGLDEEGATEYVGCGLRLIRVP